MVNLVNYASIKAELSLHDAQLVAVSKTKPIEDIVSLKALGQSSFGENYVQELLTKQESQPNLKWHFIGHLQSNKVKSIAPFIHLIHGIDSLSLLKEVNKQGEKLNRKISCLLQIFIAKEETKFGLSPEEANDLLQKDFQKQFPFVSMKGFMGMATNTNDSQLVRKEFKSLRLLFEKYQSADVNILSMGMTSDYKIALEEGSTLVRIGSAIFGERISD